MSAKKQIGLLVESDAIATAMAFNALARAGGLCLYSHTL
jgi:hypothetical protein